MEAIRVLDNRYERLEQISWWDQDRLRRSQVLVAGAGALGNEILKHLALLGIGRIAVVDFDCVEISNLTRSVLFRREDQGRPKVEVVAERLAEINPEARVLPIQGDLRETVGIGFIRRMDVVLAGLDSVAARMDLNQMCWRAGVPWIDGALEELSGTVRVFVPPDGACFECTMTDDDYRQAALRHSCQLLPSDAPEGQSVPTSPTSASVVAAWQVQEAIKWLHGKPVASSSGMSFYGLTYAFFHTRFVRRFGCLVHEPLPEVLALSSVGASSTVGDLLDLLAARLGEPVEVELDREVVLGLSCGTCGTYTPLYASQARTSVSEARCPKCGEHRDPRLTHRLRPGGSLAGERLDRLGVPPLHVLTAHGKSGRSVAFELAGDAEIAPLAHFLRREASDGNP